MEQFIDYFDNEREIHGTPFGRYEIIIIDSNTIQINKFNGDRRCYETKSKFTIELKLNNNLFEFYFLVDSDKKTAHGAKLDKFDAYEKIINFFNLYD